MSAYSDAMNNNLNDNKIEKKIFGKMQLQPFDYLINKNKWILLSICIILILIYYWILSMLFSIMIDIHSKHNYFDEHLKKEKDQLNAVIEKLIQLKEDARNNLQTDDFICHKCWFSIYSLDYKCIFSYILENDKRIKKSYDDVLFPLQNLLIQIYFLNSISITTIFKTPFRLFLLSTLFAIINLCIHAEYFIANTPNVYYTLIIGICIFLFSIFILLKILITLLTLVHYQIIKNILTTE